MATINVRLQDGSLQPMSYPDDWTDAQVQDAIYKHFPPQKEEKAPEESMLDKVLKYGVKDPIVGLANLGHGILNTPHNLAALLSEKLASHIPKQQEYDYSSLMGIEPDKKNIADKLIQFAPEAAVSIALPETKLGSLSKAITAIPKAGKYLQTALGNALSQGLFAAGQSDENQGKAAMTAGEVAAPFSVAAKGVLSGDPRFRALSKILMGTGAGALGYQGAKAAGGNDLVADLTGALMGLGGYRGINTRRLAAEKMLKGVEGTDYQNALDAADRLGLKYITPAEASGNPFTGAAQGNIGKTEQGAQALFKAGEERAASEKDSINNLLDTVFNKEKLKPQVRSLYESAYGKEVPQAELERLNENEVFKRALKMVQNKSAYKESLKGVPENSVAYLDHVKQAMDDLIEKAPSKEGRIIQKAKNDLVDVADTAAPEYKQARQLAQRENTRREIEDAFNKRPMTGTNFGKFLNDEKGYNKMLSAFKKLQSESKDLQYVKDMENAQQQLKDMKLIFGRLINIPTAKTAEALSRGSMSKDRASSATAIRMLEQLLSGNRYDKSAVELITNPKWKDELAKLKDISNTDKFIGRASQLMGTAGAQGIAQ